MKQTITHPTGWLAGREAPAADVIEQLAIEMLGHRASLEEAAQHAEDPQRQEQSLTMAQMIDRYATALYAIALQLEPERWNPEAMAGLLESARQHHIALPDWMTGSEQT